MTVQEKIQKKAERYGKFAPVFLEGAKFALNNQWISVDEDLPYNHEELLDAKCKTKEVFVIRALGFFDICYMQKIDGKWIWFPYKSIEYWMPIPELPKNKK